MGYRAVPPGSDPFLPQCPWKKPQYSAKSHWREHSVFQDVTPTPMCLEILGKKPSAQQSQGQTLEHVTSHKELKKSQNGLGWNGP